MSDFTGLAGIVLAGGQSQRMGQNKALLEFNGKPLVRHMMELLHQTGFRFSYISGNLDGYPCIPDAQPFSGPAQAVVNVWRKVPEYKGYLFVPVDMPFLTPEALRTLLNNKRGAYFLNSPLPAYLVPPFKEFSGSSVRDLISAQEAAGIPLPKQDCSCLRNLNTPDEWNQAMRRP